MVTKYCLFTTITFFILFESCNYYGAGTHGSIKSYKYPIKKVELQEAVNIVIRSNVNICLDDTTQKNFIIDVTNGKRDTLFHQHNNAYSDIKIKTDKGYCQFTFQYTGDTQDWAVDTTSEISIAYAFDENESGGSDGNGGLNWYHFGLKNKLTTLFEKEIILKIDSVLKMKHTEE
jgi:hypothetical protein